MAIKRPLVLGDDGEAQELSLSDTLPVSSSGDGKVLVAATDPIPNYLEQKLTGAQGIMIAKTAAAAPCFILRTIGDSGIVDAADAHAMTYGGGLLIDTGEFKVSPGSINFNTYGWIDVTDISNFNFGANDFTIAWWEYRGTAATYHVVFTSAGYGAVGPYFVGVSYAGNNRAWFSTDGATYNVDLDMGATTTGTWTHYKVTRASGIFYTFKNGSLVTTKSDNLDPLMSNTGKFCKVGSLGAYVADLRVNELYVINGYADTTTAFTPLETPMDMPEQYLQLYNDYTVIATKSDLSGKADLYHDTDTIKRSVTQTGHGLSVGNAIYWNGTGYVCSLANTIGTGECEGVVDTVVGDSFSFVSFGGIGGLTGLTPGENYYLSDVTPGLLVPSASKPTQAGHVDKPIMTAISTTTALVTRYRGMVIASAPGAATSISMAKIIALGG